MKVVILGRLLDLWKGGPEYSRKDRGVLTILLILNFTEMLLFHQSIWANFTKKY